MVIAINTRILSGDTAAAKLLAGYFINIAADNPSHQFYFISEKEGLHVFALNNVKTVVIKQDSSNPFRWKLWYNYKLPSALKKIKADMLVSADGMCCLRTKLPQCLLINDLEFLNSPEWYRKKYISFAKAGLPASLEKAKKIIAFSEYLKNIITNQYKINADKIEVLATSPEKKFQPLAWDKHEEVKSKYADSNEYFLYCGFIHERNNLTNLLKAFSLFKKRQKSSMQLLLVTGAIPPKNAFVESLRLYKYRSDVKLLAVTDENEISMLVAAAWCCINLSPLFSDIHFLQNALQCEVPVITGDNEQAIEILGGAALYAKPNSIAAIAEQMMQVYKDENKRNEMIQAWNNFPEKDKGNNVKSQLWRHIVAVAQK